MKKSEFLQEMYDMLEITSIEKLSEDTIIRELEEYNSLFVLTIIALIDEKFSIQLTAEQLNKISSVISLMELVGIEKFED